MFLRGPSSFRTACVAGATYLLLCGGHPQIAYLGFAGAILAMLCLGPALRATVVEPVPARGTLAGCFGGATAGLLLGVLLSAAYLAPFYFDFLAAGTQRTGREFSWTYTPFGTHSAVSLLHSLFRPFSSDVNGSFGGPAILGVALLAPVAAIRRRAAFGILLTWLVAVTVLALALAETLPLYLLAWRFVPLFSSFRVPGRVTMMAAFPLLLLLAWICRARGERVGSREGGLRPLVLLGLIAAVLYAMYPLLSVPSLDALELAPPVRILERRALESDHARLAELLRPGMRVLDVGCGSGSITEGIARAVRPGGTALDRDAELIRRAVARTRGLPSLEFRVASILDLDERDAYDVVTAARALQWISDVPGALERMVTATRPGGRVVVLDYDHADLVWRPEPPPEVRCFYAAFLSWRAANGWDNRMASRLLELLAAAGLEEIHVTAQHETARRGEPGFDEALGIWAIVMADLGPDIARAGFLAEQEWRAALRAYRWWQDEGAEYQEMVLRAVDGRRLA